MLVDKHTNFRNVEPLFVRRSCFGQLCHIFALELKKGTPGNMPGDDDLTILLAQIHEAPVQADKAFDYPIYHYEKLTRFEVVDASTIMCTVGRVHDRGRWAIFDRSGEHGFPDYDEES
jgi:hypothetical protein